uniref:Uncharacterized protein n=1 Tax=Rhizophora mucronata TaxID=61149 RepID=A0A2P2NLR0_RHIMU
MDESQWVKGVYKITNSM